jgi:hypothetical protein
LEALACVLNMIEEGDDGARIRRQVEGARDDLLRGVTLDFRQKLRIRWSLASSSVLPSFKLRSIASRIMH